MIFITNCDIILIWVYILFNFLFSLMSLKRLVNILTIIVQNYVENNFILMQLCTKLLFSVTYFIDMCY